MIFGSVCSGIEAASVAWHPLGWRAAFLSEIERFPCAVLAHHYAETPNYGDMTQFKEWPDAAIDILVGGTPCQSFSVAGLRKGLADPRGNLMLTYGAIAKRYRPRWLVWENVPGVLSSDGGRDFGTFLGMLAELGYGFAYRVLDAQHFGVPQRRRRVFVVGHLGSWQRAAAVLFERSSLRGDSPPSREAREANPVGTLCGSHGNVRADEAWTGRLIPELSFCLNAGGMGRMDAESETLIAHTLRAAGFDASEDGSGRGTPLVAMPFDTTQITSKTDRSQPGLGRECHTLSKGMHAPAIAIGFGHQEDRNFKASEESSSAITRNQGVSVARAGAVRRLTPRECERLQGFPDDYTLVISRGKPAADGPRYKALGNSMAVPVMRWIGLRIESVSAIELDKAA